MLADGVRLNRAPLQSGVGIQARINTIICQDIPLEMGTESKHHLMIQSSTFMRYGVSFSRIGNTQARLRFLPQAQYGYFTVS